MAITGRSRSLWLLLGCLLVPLSTAVAEDADDLADNPYSAKAGLSGPKLVDYLDRMSEKPMSIKQRPGFKAAVIDAAGRALAADLNDKQRVFAALMLFETLHYDAERGDEEADEKLMTWAAKLADAKQDRISKRAYFHLLEKRAAEGRELEGEKREALLKELQGFFAEEKLAERHLRLASATIAILNNLEDKARANKLFDELGGLLAKSDDKLVARYGKKILKKPAANGKPAGPKGRLAELVGKPLELKGHRVDGGELKWKSYRGKVVLVDFWATWCGPCIAEQPNIKAAYQKFHKRGFEVVAISIDADKETLEAFIDENKIAWINVHDGEGTIAKQYGINAIPAMLLVGKDGKVVSANARGEQLDKLLTELLGAPEAEAKAEDKAEE